MPVQNLCAVCGKIPRYALSPNPYFVGRSTDDFTLYSCKKIRCIEAVVYCCTVATQYPPCIAFSDGVEEEGE